MSVSPAKVKADAPAASPSRPSVRFTAFAPAVTMKVAQTNHSAVPRTTPGTLARVNEITVSARAKCCTASAKPTPTSSCRMILPRLFSPRLRWRRTFSQSSVKPIAPAATSASMTNPPAQVNRALSSRCPRRYPAVAATMIASPPIVGVPSFTM